MGGPVFGIIRPCQHRLGSELGAAWQAHLCGVCLALRDDHGQAARLVTNYDALVVSVLVEAQSAAPAARRPAGRCVLRRMRRAQVAAGDGARFAGAVSLMLAAAKLRDHVADRDGVASRNGVRVAAGQLARRWARQGAESGSELGFATAVLTGAIGQQARAEAAVGPGSAVLAVTEPTETATAAVFAHTAVLAGRPGNQAALAEAGRLFGRIAHLLDAVEDLPADRASGAWNPLAATETPVAEARRLCEDALLGIRLALVEAELADARLARLLLEDELSRSVRHTFGHSNRALQPQARPGGPARRFSPCPAAAASGHDDIPLPETGTSGQPGNRAHGDLPPSRQDAAPPPPTRHRNRNAWHDRAGRCEDCLSCFDWCDCWT
ncbi:MAG TPA: DUF5685 family protein [Streptosporangiaceae bacterium]